MSPKKLLSVLLLPVFVLILTGCGTKSRTGEPKILVFSKTAGFRHSSIEDGQKAIMELGERKGFLVDTSENAEVFTDDNLQQYSAVVFLSTTGDILNTNQEIAFERYIQAGGGFMGIHAATDTEYDWKWYGRLVGAYFKSHPAQQEAKLNIHSDSEFPLLDSFPDPWERKDEWYNFRKVPDHVKVLISIDETSYEGGSNDNNHPMVWYHEFDGGRAFYNGLGHTPESFQEPEYLDLLYVGIEYAIGHNEVLDYSKAKSEYPPDANRFSKVEFVRGLDEPTELTILPDLSVLITERKGGLKYYSQKTGELKEVADFEVYHYTEREGVNVEMGFMGIKADPHYSENHWVYVFYSPIDKSVDRLSRFKFKDGVWDMDSEQIILDVETDREICCHTGGSIAFDADGLLYVSTGDNSTPFNEKDPETGKSYAINTHSYAPLDDREGFYNHDVRRSSGNSNDLRGKILRIKMNEDGSYEIPKGNLFEKDNPKARPEIYVMGNRNPYRISIDQKTGFLYWGEVGPDARNDSLDTRGPKGYDEVNQAREAGNFGWPYFVGDNFAYWEYDYDKGESLFKYDPEKPVNNSRHNTGMKELPPAQPAFIYYPYDVSDEFPQLGTGGRNAMAGPVYYGDMYPAENRLPEYFDGKLFIYDWIRNWIKVVEMNEEGDLMRIDPFMPDQKFYNIIDMEMGPDGKIYILEYGTGWFTQNDNSSLSVIEYNSGNRAPEAHLALEKVAGQVPFQLKADASTSADPDGDELKYSWYLNDELLETETGAVLNHTIDKPGVYSIFVEVDDRNGARAKSSVSTVVTGNTRPEVKVKVGENSQFYFDHTPVYYDISVKDEEDGSTEDGSLDINRISVKMDYLEGFDQAAVKLGHQEVLDPELEVETIISGNDCASCHKKDEKSIGPSYVEVAAKYKGQAGADEYLMDKIRNGGSGVWGEVAMSAHPDINPSDVRKIVSWIQSLASDEEEKIVHKNKGQIIPVREFNLSEEGTLIISASYTDNGAEGSQPLTGTETVHLRRPVLSLHDATEVKGGTKGNYSGMNFLLSDTPETTANMGEVDLTGIKYIEVQYTVTGEDAGSRDFSLHKGGPDGPVIASGTSPEGIKPMQPTKLRMQLKSGADSNTEALWFSVKSKEGDIPVAITKLELSR